MHSSHDIIVRGVALGNTLHADVDFESDATPTQIETTLWHPVHPISVRDKSAALHLRFELRNRSLPSVIIPQAHFTPSDGNIEYHILVPKDVNCNLRIPDRCIDEAAYVLDGEGVELRATIQRGLIKSRKGFV